MDNIEKIHASSACINLQCGAFILGGGMFLGVSFIYRFFSYCTLWRN